MSSLIDELLAVLPAHSVVQSIRVVNYDETPTGKLELKIRRKLIKSFQFQLWLHHEPAFRDYAYQLFTTQPILRWDNAPHYPHITTSPHHFHDEYGNIQPSALTGNTIDDLNQVLSKVETWILQTTN